MQRGFHQIFIHTDGGGRHIAGGIGDAEQLQIAHQRAVLHIGAVYRGDHDVKSADHIAAKGFMRIAEQIHPVGAGHRQDADGLF